LLVFGVVLVKLVAIDRNSKRKTNGLDC
jgi:hypothetical protein